MRSGAVLAALAVGSACGRVAFDPRGDGAAGAGDVGSPDAEVDPDLVVYFPLDDGDTPDVVDKVAGAVAMCTAANCPPPVTGKIGDAYLFDGADDCFRMSDAPALRPAAFTLSIWVNHSATRNDSIIGKLVGPLASQADSFQLETGTGGSFPADAVAYATSPGGGAGNNFIVSGAGALPLDSWHHVAATFDSGTKRLYVDGTQRATNIGTVAYDATDLTIGCDVNVSNQQYFVGMLDEVRIYRRALTPAEIMSLASGT